MRKSLDKKDLYESIKKQNFLLPPPIETKPADIKLPSIIKRNSNVIRVGCPTEILIHIPEYNKNVKFEPKTSRNKLENSLKQLLHEKAKNKLETSKKSSIEIWKEFDSIKVPIKSFSDLKLPSHYFSLDSVKKTEDQENYQKVLKKLEKKQFFKELSPQSQSIKDKFTINHEVLFPPCKSPYFTSPFLFSRSSD